jgi:hypothetical protein
MKELQVYNLSNNHISINSALYYSWWFLEYADPGEPQRHVEGPVYPTRLNLPLI